MDALTMVELLWWTCRGLSAFLGIVAAIYLFLSSRLSFGAARQRAQKSGGLTASEAVVMCLLYLVLGLTCYVFTIFYDVDYPARFVSEVMPLAVCAGIGVLFASVVVATTLVRGVTFIFKRS